MPFIGDNSFLTVGFNFVITSWNNALSPARNPLKFLKTFRCSSEVLLNLKIKFFITHTKFLVSKMLETALILLYLTPVVKTTEEGVYFKVRENYFLLIDENTVWDEKVDSLLSCSQICGRRNDCKYVNFKKDQRICSISDRQSSGKVLQRQGYFYFKKVGFFERYF